MTHIVLLGDSIFDNGSYVPEGRDVVSHLRQELDGESRATLLAVDGATVDDVAYQIRNIPDDATYLMLSAGGNDALLNMEILTAQTRTVADALSKLAIVRDRFSDSYRQLIRSLAELKKPLVLCTIYHPPMFEDESQPVVSTALSIFNDTILGIAFEESLSVIETRLVCNDETDFVSTIEPSDSGGAKIARALANTVSGEAASPRSHVFAS